MGELPPGEAIHIFANGLKVSRRHLTPQQVERYGGAESGNLHEPEEEAWLGEVLRRSGEAGLFVDGGASLGYYSALVARQKPGWHIRAMEPLPRFRDAVAETLSLNGLDGDRVWIDARALSDTDGEVSFVDRAFGSRVLGPSARAPETPASVASVTLETLLGELGRPITLLKLDIQGHEGAVLQAGRAALAGGQVEALIIGTHGAGLHRDLLSLIGASHTILHEDPAPRGQPDGLIVAMRHETPERKAP